MSACPGCIHLRRDGPFVACVRGQMRVDVFGMQAVPKNVLAVEVRADGRRWYHVEAAVLDRHACTARNRILGLG